MTHLPPSPFFFAEELLVQQREEAALKCFVTGGGALVQMALGTASFQLRAVSLS